MFGSLPPNKRNKLYQETIKGPRKKWRIRELSLLVNLEIRLEFLARKVCSKLRNVAKTYLFDF